LSERGSRSRFVEALIARDRGRLADFRDRARHPRVAVAVDDEARIVLPDERRIEATRERDPDRADADVPGDMARGFGRRQAEPVEAAWKDAPGMVAGQKEDRRARLVVERDRRGAVGGGGRGRGPPPYKSPGERAH